MKIAQVVTFVSADGSYGGPVAVAQELARESSRRGHEVDLLAGWDGREQSVGDGNVELKLFRARRLLPVSSFAPLFSASLLVFLIRRARSFDVIHFHFARDLVAVPGVLVVRLLRVPYVLQTHGMVMPDERRSIRALDRLIVRKLIEGAGQLYALTRLEVEGVQKIAPRANVRLLRNGIALGSMQKKNTQSTVLFCSRLHQRKRPRVFVEMALRLLERGSSCDFRVVGADEGEATAICEMIDNSRWRSRITYVGPVSRAAAATELAKAKVLVLPSRDEPFPMVVLESLAVGTPVVLTESCGIAGELRDARAAVVTDGSVEDVCRAVNYLTTDEMAAAQLAQRGHMAVRTLYSLDAVTETLLKSYEELPVR